MDDTPYRELARSLDALPNASPPTEEAATCACWPSCSLPRRPRWRRAAPSWRPADRRAAPGATRALRSCSKRWPRGLIKPGERKVAGLRR